MSFLVCSCVCRCVDKRWFRKRDHFGYHYHFWMLVSALIPPAAVALFANIVDTPKREGDEAVSVVELSRRVRQATESIATTASQATVTAAEADRRLADVEARLQGLAQQLEEVASAQRRAQPLPAAARTPETSDTR